MPSRWHLNCLQKSITKTSLKFYVTILLMVTSSVSFADDDLPEDSSRRGFLKAVVATATSAAVAPSVVSEIGTATRVKIPPEIKRQLARFRLESLDTVESGLEVYIEKLKEIAQNTNSKELEVFLKARVKSAEQALSVFNNVKINSQGEEITRFELQQDVETLRLPEKERLKEKQALNQSRLNSLSDLQSMPHDVRTLLIRGLLDVGLMNRMAWQAHFGAEAQILDAADADLLQSYKEMLAITLESAPKNSLSSLLIPKLLKEARFVLSNSPVHKLKKRNTNRSFSCGKFI